MPTFSRHAVLDWVSDGALGSATVTAGTASFAVPAGGPRLLGEAPGVTTPEEMLAGSHAICYGIGLRSLLAQRGAKAKRVTVTAVITAEKGPGGIRITSSHLAARVEGLEGADPVQLEQIARATEQGCTISNAIRPAVAISVEVTAS